MKRLLLAAVLVAIFAGLAATPAFAGPLPGAIFTTLQDGARVNANIYEAKEDVYLDGGPGPNAPSSAAALPEGDYYFQVTDPSGKVLLSVDPVASRMVRVNEHGVIDHVYAAAVTTKYKGTDYGTHATGVDIDHDELGAITVQLMPYKDTPNKGGVYKVWMTPVDRFVGDPAEVDNPDYFHGFIPAWSKTDNYKVKRKGNGPEPSPTLITVLKFHDMNANGEWDEGEPEIEGWPVDVTDPLGSTNTYYTPAVIIADPVGVYSMLEATPAGTLQTASYLDGALTAASPDNPVAVNVAADDFSHEVIFGNVGLGRIEVAKIYDLNANGEADEGEPGVPGWRFSVVGTLAHGDAYGPTLLEADANGMAELTGLLPGHYTVTELMPLGDCWHASGPLFHVVDIVSTLTDGILAGSVESVVFTNYCEGEADFGTKGFWHNKNGLDILSSNPGWIAYVNGLAPYSAPSGYFGAGDEPFDGLYEDGTPVGPAFNDEGHAIWGAGTWQAEVSQFLVDANAGGDPREQLAQQLLAFIFNVKASGAAMLELDGEWVSTDTMIADAIDAWLAGGSAANYWQGILVGFNESDAVPIIRGMACEVIYE
ncbi:MAG: hypothetical protein P1P71_06660 [Anaerosomatales bacterium]|nr:hypothetical protein [Anaerosomatales bacterium]